MPPIRTTQRIPLSCTACAAKKVKCSKDIPCKACIKRGIAASCQRETVRVRGQLRTADSPLGDLSYNELLHENARLAALLCMRDGGDEPRNANIDVTGRFETELWEAVGHLSKSRQVGSRDHIHFPSQQCSDAIVARAAIWTSWIHYAFFFPHFQREHDQYWTNQQDANPLWLALYFGVLSSTLLFMDDNEYEQTMPPSVERLLLLRNWYDTALFFLDEADFMQRAELQVVQAVTILGIVSTNIGDTARHSHLWAIALRVAQALKLGTDSEHQNEAQLQREARRRLWWTLIICEWLPIPARSPCISTTDFACDLPDDVDDESLLTDSHVKIQGPRPVQYHIAMSKVAVVLNRFRSTLRARPWSATQIAQIVSSADNELALLISELPPHLQTDESSSTTLDIEKLNPWIPFQRRSLTLVLLHHGIVINRVLQNYWLEGSPGLSGSRAMCLNSAIAIIHVASTDNTDYSTSRPWALAMHVFCALTIVVQENREMSPHDAELSQYTALGIKFLEQVQSDNIVAKEGLNIIHRLSQPSGT